MKFLCVPCDEAMKITETKGPEDGSLAVVFGCPSCRRQVAMLTNPMETQMVRSLCEDRGTAGPSRSDGVRSKQPCRQAGRGAVAQRTLLDRIRLPLHLDREFCVRQARLNGGGDLDRGGGRTAE